MSSLEFERKKLERRVKRQNWIIFALGCIVIILIFLMLWILFRDLRIPMPPW